jgi:hypothetical protein
MYAFQEGLAAAAAICNGDGGSGRTGLEIPSRYLTIPAYGLIPTKSKGHILCYIIKMKQHDVEVAHHIPLPRDRHEANQVLKECTCGRSDCCHFFCALAPPLTLRALALAVVCEIAGLDKTDYAGKTIDKLGKVVDIVSAFAG